MALLEITHLSFQVPERPVLAGVDLSLEAGEIHALVGANGAGKSTLAYQVRRKTSSKRSGSLANL